MPPTGPAMLSDYRFCRRGRKELITSFADPTGEARFATTRCFEISGSAIKGRPNLLGQRLAVSRGQLIRQEGARNLFCRSNLGEARFATMWLAIPPCSHLSCHVNLNNQLTRSTARPPRQHSWNLYYAVSFEGGHYLSTR